MTFANDLINTHGAAELFEGTNMTDGTVIATVDTAHNGFMDGVTVQDEAVPFPGESGLAPYLDGSSGANLLGSSLADVLTSGALSVLLFAKIVHDNVARNTFWFADGASNQLGIRKLANGDLKWRTLIDGVYHQPFITVANHGRPDGWTMLTVTQAAGSENQLRGYIGPTQVVGESSIQTFGAFTSFGLGGAGGSNAGFKGHLAYVAVFDYVLPRAQIAAIYRDSGL